jgi:hypothetical protein
MWLRKLYKIQRSLLPNADNVAKKPPAHAAGLKKTAKMSTAPPCTVSAACFKTTGAINKKNYNKMHFLKRLHKCLNRGMRIN